MSASAEKIAKRTESKLISGLRSTRLLSALCGQVWSQPQSRLRLSPQKSSFTSFGVTNHAIVQFPG